MNRLIKSISLGIGALILVVGATIATQAYINTNTSAANTLTGANEIITIATTDGLPVNDTVTVQSYSADGNVILFVSKATNLPNPTTFSGIYTYNIKNNITARVDISTAGVLPNSGYFGFTPPRLSETGRYVTFSSEATNLIDGSATGAKMIYKRDTQNNTTDRVVLGYAGGYSDKWDRNLAVSNDARFVLVMSRYVDNNPYPYTYKIQMGDGATGTYTWREIVRANSSQSWTNISLAEMSCDGSFIFYKKSTVVYLTDTRNGLTTQPVTGGLSTSPLISCNGRYLLYATAYNTEIMPQVAGNSMSKYLHLARYDRVTGEKSYVDLNSSGTFSSSGFQYYTSAGAEDQQVNVFGASIADTGDVVFNYNGSYYLKHLSDGSGTLESIAKNTSGSSVLVNNGAITSNGQYIFFQTDPYNLGLTGSPSNSQIIRTKANLY